MAVKPRGFERLLRKVAITRAELYVVAPKQLWHHYELNEVCAVGGKVHSELRHLNFLINLVIAHIEKMLGHNLAQQDFLMQLLTQ